MKALFVDVGAESRNATESKGCHIGMTGVFNVEFSELGDRARAAVAEAETVHALNHLRIADEIGTTVSNLDEAINGETFEFTKMYPAYLELARKEGNKQAEWSFNVANQVEEIHAGLFKKALNALKNNEDMPDTDYYVCNVCGNTVENSAPEKCPICGAPKAQFLKMK